MLLEIYPTTTGHSYACYFVGQRVSRNLKVVYGLKKDGYTFAYKFMTDKSLLC